METLHLRKPKKRPTFTSWHYRTVTTTPRRLITLAEKLDIPYYGENTGEDKTNYDFEFETRDGHYFTVYDYKIYRPLKMDTLYEFHIGGQTSKDTDKGQEALIRELEKL